VTAAAAAAVHPGDWKEEEASRQKKASKGGLIGGKKRLKEQTADAIVARRACQVCTLRLGRFLLGTS